MANSPHKNQIYREWYARNKEKKKKQVQERHQSISHEYHRMNNVKKLYGLSWEDYLSLYESQDGCCAICSTPKLPFKSDPSQLKTDIMYVDHDHSTGEVRGLLCNMCNDLLGRAKDNINIFASAIKYLSKETQ